MRPFFCFTGLLCVFRVYEMGYKGGWDFLPKTLCKKAVDVCESDPFEP